MRLVNWLLIRILLTALFALTFLYGDRLDAQQNGNLPTVRQSSNSSLAVNPGVFGSAVQSGDWLVFNYCWESPGAPTAITSCTDANGIIPSFTVGNVGTNAACATNLFDPECNIQSVWGKATSTGNPSISCVTTFPRQNVFASQELTGNLAFDSQSQSSSNGADPSISVTTTAQKGVAVSAVCQNGQTLTYPDKALQFGAEPVISDLFPLMQNWFRTGATGVNTAQYHFSANPSVSAIIALKPTAITVGTTLMPDGGVGTAYKAVFTAYGGSGAYTWTLTSGSCGGLSITDATNGVYSGTPTVAGTCTIKPHVTDGTNSADGPNLTFTIGSVLQSISAPTCRTFTTNPNGATLNVATGDPLILAYLGDDQHGQTGYIVQNNTDSFGDTYVRIGPITGGMAGPIQVYTSKATASGTVNPVYTVLGGTPLAGVFCTAKGAQQIVDDLVTNIANPGAVNSTTLASTYTTPVPNGLLLTLSTLNCLATGGASCTMTTSTNAPFTSLASVVGFGGVPFAAYQESTTTATGYSATSNYADSTSADMSRDAPIQAMIFLRPAAPPGVTVFGEKPRRHPN